MASASFAVQHQWISFQAEQIIWPWSFLVIGSRLAKPLSGRRLSSTFSFSQSSLRSVPVGEFAFCLQHDFLQDPDYRFCLCLFYQTHLSLLLSPHVAGILSSTNCKSIFTLAEALKFGPLKSIYMLKPNIITQFYKLYNLRARCRKFESPKFCISCKLQLTSEINYSL